MFKKIARISVIDAQKQMAETDAALIDVHEPGEYAGGHAAGAISMPLSKIEASLDRIPGDKTVFVICQSGPRSQQAAAFLTRNGFENVVSVNGGTAAWRDAGLPMVLTKT